MWDAIAASLSTLKAPPSPEGSWAQEAGIEQDEAEDQLEGKQHEGSSSNDLDEKLISVQTQGQAKEEKEEEHFLSHSLMPSDSLPLVSSSSSIESISSIIDAETQTNSQDTLMVNCQAAKDQLVEASTQTELQAVPTICNCQAAQVSVCLQPDSA